MPDKKQAYPANSMEKGCRGRGKNKIRFFNSVESHFGYHAVFVFSCLIPVNIVKYDIQGIEFTLSY